MGGFKDVLVMVGLQCIYSGIVLFSKVAFDDGLNPQIFVAYRQMLATFLMGTFALLSKKKSGSSLRLELKTFALIFVAALFGITLTESAYYEGIYFATASVASALCNLTSAATYVMAVLVRLERVNVRSLRGAAKILGTIVAIAGAAAVSLLRGPVIVDVKSSIRPGSGSSTSSSTWLLGCLLCVWKLLVLLSLVGFAETDHWQNKQVSVTKNCPDHVYSTFLTCFFGAVQTTVLAMFMERHVDDWKLDKPMEYVACIFSGVASTVAFFAQAWCISRRGPVFSATFYPLSTVIVTIIGSIFLGESIYLGSLLGAVAIIIGLYMVLWGKATDNIKGSTIKLEESGFPIDKSVIDPVDLPITGTSNQLDIEASHDSIHDRSRSGARI